MLRFLEKHISPKTIFILTATKLAFWSASMIWFGVGFFPVFKDFEIGAFLLTKVVMFISAVLGLINVFKWRNQPLFTVLSFFYCFLWVYLLIGYALTKGVVIEALVFRNLPEVFFIFYMMFGLYDDPNVYDEESLRDISANRKEWCANQNKVS